MDSARLHQALVVLGIVFAAVVAIVAVAGGPVVPVAATGGIVIGALWAIAGVLERRRSE